MFLLPHTPHTPSGNEERVSNIEYIFYCKRAILFLLSSKILTPHPPLRPASMSSPRNKGGGTHSPRGEGDGGGVNILEDERNRIALLQQNIYSAVTSRGRVPAPKVTDLRYQYMGERWRELEGSIFLKHVTPLKGQYPKTVIWSFCLICDDVMYKKFEIFFSQRFCVFCVLCQCPNL